MKILIFGHGYTAGFLTRLAFAEGWQVTGTTRANSKGVQEAGASVRLWPGQEEQIRDDIAAATAILVSAPPAETGDPVLAMFKREIAQSQPRWLGYLSTTGVYGDREGGWVDESSPLEPSTGRGRARVTAEVAWQELADEHNLPLHIFRLAGIYGPGRGPFAKLRAGTARRIIKPGQVFSRIHAMDAARVLMASIKSPSPGGIYNLCDDDPAPPQEVIAYAAELLGMPPPTAEPFDQAAMTPMARSFYAESKRVSNARIKRDFGITLEYPDYRNGLAAILAAEGDG